MSMERSRGEDPTRNFKLDARLMREKAGSKLPNLDYMHLKFAQLEQIKKSQKTPGGKYENLIIFLQQRSGKQLDAAELDRRMRTFFEDMITRITQSPQDYDGDVTLNGRALMDYLSGVPVPEEAPKPKPEPEGQGGVTG